jgi:hypothetical protein
MAQGTTLGVDIAKNGVCLHGIDTQGHVIVKKPDSPGFRGYPETNV